MMYLDDIQKIVEQNLSQKVDRREMLMLCVDLNILHERERDALYRQHSIVTSGIIRDERRMCEMRCFRLKSLTIAGWIVAMISLLALTMAGI